MEVASMVIVGATVGAAIAAWWALLSLAHEMVRPRLDRWLWHRLGGSGNPPPPDFEDRQWK